MGTATYAVHGVSRDIAFAHKCIFINEESGLCGKHSVHGKRETIEYSGYVIRLLSLVK
jgi:hypothetical protein